MAPSILATLIFSSASTEVIQRRSSSPEAKGTGLGLQTARQIIVDRHHGSLTLESQPGRTVVRARLPVQAARH